MGTDREKKTVILNVDDDEEGRYATTRILKGAGYEVVEAATGAEALEMVRNNPDLVILDVRLPDIHGFEVCKRIKGDEGTRHIPIIHLSATYIDPKSEVDGLTAGADNYLTQPIEPSLLLASIQSLLRIKYAERALKEALSEKEGYITKLKQLMHFNLQISGMHYETDVINSAGSILNEQFNPDIIYITLLDKSENVMVACYSKSSVPIDEVIDVKFFKGPSVCSVMQTGQKRIVRDIRKDQACDCLLYKMEEGGYICLPIKVGWNVEGVIIMIKVCREFWDEETCELISTYADIASLSILRTRYAEQAKDTIIRRFIDQERAILESKEVNARRIEVKHLLAALKGSVRPLPEGSDIHIVFEGAGGFTSLYTDETKLLQILRNFMSNAIRLSGGGEIRVSARSGEGGDDAVFSVFAAGTEIPREDQESLFHENNHIPVHSLAATRKLAKMLGGTVSLESRPGIGSTFIAIIPIIYSHSSNSA